MFWSPASPDLNPLAMRCKIITFHNFTNNNFILQLCIDYGVWSLMKKYIFDLGARTKETALDAIDSFFRTHQQVIKDCILGSVR